MNKCVRHEGRSELSDWWRVHARRPSCVPPLSTHDPTALPTAAHLHYRLRFPYQPALDLFAYKPLLTAGPHHAPPLTTSFLRYLIPYVWGGGLDDGLLGITENLLDQTIRIAKSMQQQQPQPQQ